MTNINQLDSSQSYDEPSTIGLVQIPPPTSPTACRATSSTPTNSRHSAPTLTIGTELIKKHDVSHYCH